MNLSRFNPFRKEQAPVCTSIKSKCDCCFYVEKNNPLRKKHGTSSCIIFLDKESQRVLTAPPPQNAPRSNIVWQFTEKLWEITFWKIKYEFANWELPWNIMSKGEFIKLTLIALFGFLSGNWDVGSDSQVAYSYFVPTEYTFFFDNQSDPIIER